MSESLEAGERGWSKQLSDDFNKLAWECDECGAQEYTMGVSEVDVHKLNCSVCGGWNWHKANERK